MNNFNWKALFNPVAKQEWTQQIASDYKGEYPKDLLINQVGEGITTHAVLTREDIKKLPHLQDQSSNDTLKWERSADWQICTPLLVSMPLHESVSRAQAATQAGAECLLIECESGLTENNLYLFLTEISQSNIPFHLRVPSSLLALSLSEVSPRSVQTINSEPIEDISAITTISQLPKTLSGNTTGLKSTTLWIPEFGKTNQNTLGDMLLSIQAYINKHQGPSEGVQSLLDHFCIVLQISSSFYVEVARIRALRHLISQFIAMTHSESNQTLNIPFFAEIISRQSDLSQNLIETSTRALSAILGGCDTVMIRPSSEEGKMPSAEAIRLTTNAQLILKHEAHLNRVIDPGAGSYHIEWLTNQFIETAWNYYESKQ